MQILKTALLLLSVFVCGLRMHKSYQFNVEKGSLRTNKKTRKPMPETENLLIFHMYLCIVHC